MFVAGVNTAILVTSSFTMHWAMQSIKRNNRRGLQAGLVLTILMGSAFLLTQMLEYAHVGFNTGDGAFASVFFGLTGLHGAHVFVGLTLLTIAAVRAFRGHYSAEHHHGVEIPGIYWHFVDVMWIVVYAAVYPASDARRRQCERGRRSCRCPCRNPRIDGRTVLAEEASCRTRSDEAAAFQFVLARSSTSALIVVAAWIATWLGVVVFVVLTVVAVWLLRGGRAHQPPSAARRARRGRGQAADPRRRERDGRGRGAASSVARKAEGVAEDVLVVCPALNSRVRTWASDEDAARAAAQARLDATLARLAAAGINARGEIGDGDPLQALEDALRDVHRRRDRRSRPIPRAVELARARRRGGDRAALRRAGQARRRRSRARGARRRGVPRRATCRRRDET